MLVFLDTEFTGLDHRWPRLISIGLVSEDGAHCFYAETPRDTYLDKCSSWVVGNVLPLLKGGKYIMRPKELGEALTAWLEGLGDVVVVCDSPDFDFAFLRATLSPWPRCVDITPLRFDDHSLGDGSSELNAVRELHLGPGGHKAHNALADAQALRAMWLAARKMAAFQPFAERLARVNPHPTLQALVKRTCHE